MRKILVITGPTGTGKTLLALNLAKLFKGELISADSRQVYKGMDIITGKDLPVNSKFKIQNSKLNSKIQKELNLNITVGIYVINQIPLWGLDYVKPDQQFSVAHFIKISQLIIKEIWARKKLPIIVGGTGFWIKALMGGIETIGILPDQLLRKKLGNLEIEKLRNILAKTDRGRLEKMNTSDRQNPRRLIRAIEICQYKKKLATVNKKTDLKTSQNIAIATNCKILLIGLKTEKKLLYQLIDQRVAKRIKQGAKQEIEKLIKHGYTWDLPSFSACGYRVWEAFLEKKQTLARTIEQWKNQEHAYARRQLTWFNKEKNIKWFTISKKNWQHDVVKLVKSWYY